MPVFHPLIRKLSPRTLSLNKFANCHYFEINITFSYNNFLRDNIDCSFVTIGDSYQMEKMIFMDFEIARQNVLANDAGTNLYCLDTYCPQQHM